jgi:hypothetical protein
MFSFLWLENVDGVTCHTFSAIVTPGLRRGMATLVPCYFPWVTRGNLAGSLLPGNNSVQNKKAELLKVVLLRQPGFLLSGRSKAFRTLFPEGLALSGTNLFGQVFIAI